jgi:hypothetical protein
MWSGNLPYPKRVREEIIVISNLCVRTLPVIVPDINRRRMIRTVSLCFLKAVHAIAATSSVPTNKVLRRVRTFLLTCRKAKSVLPLQETPNLRAFETVSSKPSDNEL